jgi:hypothetical protein
MSENVKTDEPAPPAKALNLWIGMLLPPIVWAAQLQTLWLTSEYGCFTSSFKWNHLVSIISLVLSAFGTWLAFSEYKRWGADQEDDSSDPRSRRRFMAMLGILTGLLFTIVIFAQWLPTLLGVPCDK